MKKYYHTLSKDKKKEIKEIYNKEYKKTDIHIRLVRLGIYAAIGYLTSLVIFIDAFLEDTQKIGNIIIGTTLLIASTTFLVGKILIKLKLLNKIALKNK